MRALQFVTALEEWKAKSPKRPLFEPKDPRHAFDAKVLMSGAQVDDLGRLAMYFRGEDGKSIEVKLSAEDARTFSQWITDTFSLDGEVSEIEYSEPVESVGNEEEFE